MCRFHWVITLVCSFDARVDDSTEIVPSNQSIERLNRPVELVLESLFMYPIVFKGIFSRFQRREWWAQQGASGVS